jgi:putative DNA primase/helicase
MDNITRLAEKQQGPPIITVEAGKRHIAADQGIAALVAGDVPFYQRNRKIQRVALVPAKNTCGEIMDVPGIVSVDIALMERELGRSAAWQRYDIKQKKHVAIDPPTAVSSQILSMVGQWPFAPLTGIIQCPTLRRDGSLLDRPGYDEATGLILVGDVSMPTIVPRPTRPQALQALTTLLALLEEFPFVDPESKAVALSMFISPVVRGAMAVAPMHLTTAPLPGTGKSYLADCASMIATGERCAVKSAAPSYEETEKRLIGAALAGSPIIALDNCRDGIAGDFFCQVVERPLMELRALGRSDQHRIPNTFTMFVNGNNAGVAEDMVRRTIRSGLDANLENPETRTFRGNPLAAIQRDRGRYIAAALTIPLAYIAAGRPIRCSPLVSFEEWCSLVRDPLIWLDCGDPVATQEKLRTDDPRKTEKVAIFKAWMARIGVGRDRRGSTKEIIAAANTDEALQEGLLAVAAQRFSADRGIDRKALGKWLSAQEGSIAAKCKLIADRTDTARPKWYLDFNE